VAAARREVEVEEEEVGMTVRTAFVTGAAQGLGEAIARSLHARGDAVAVADVNVAGAAALAEELGERARAVELDVRDRSAWERAWAEAADWRGPISILVNNAARTTWKPVFELEAEEWDDVLATNLRSVLFGCQIAGPAFRSLGWGRIVNMASLAGQQGGVVSGAHYAASKAGIVVLTKIVAAELARDGVTVNAVAPAAIDGPIMQSLPPERVSALADRIPVGRVGRPDEVGSLVAWLTSDHAGYVTGATFDINGGLNMR
jgi:3-oxoacyl-[acyl-carrier protein] reductase